MAPSPEELAMLDQSLSQTSNGSGHPADEDSEYEDSPIQIRQKVHSAEPMTTEQAVYEMELVGHDFFLFCHAESGRPSAVYRRRGWEYGVLHLDVDPALRSPAGSVTGAPATERAGTT